MLTCTTTNFSPSRRPGEQTEGGTPKLFLECLHAAFARHVACELVWKPKLEVYHIDLTGNYHAEMPSQVLPCLRAASRGYHAASFEAMKRWYDRAGSLERSQNTGPHLRGNQPCHGTDHRRVEQSSTSSGNASGTDPLQSELVYCNFLPVHQTQASTRCAVANESHNSIPSNHRHWALRVPPRPTPCRPCFCNGLSEQFSGFCS